MDYVDLTPFKKGLNAQNYFKSHGISQEVISRFGVKIDPIINEKILIKFPLANGCIKNYWPLGNENSTERKFTYSNGNKDEIKAFGLDLLPEFGNTLLIMGGQKDCLMAASLGYHAISTQSETIFLPGKIIYNFKRRFNDVIIFFDNDNPGREASSKFCREFGLKEIFIPKSAQVKDISDYALVHKDLNGLKAFIDTEIKRINTEKSNFSIHDILENEYNVEYDWIMENIVPAESMLLLAGGSDLGKSTIASQFALSLTTGEPFLNQKLNKRGPVLYLCFEEYKQDVAMRFKKMVSGISQESKLHLRDLKIEIISNDYLEKINSHLLNYPDTVAIVIDPLGSTFKGDINAGSSDLREHLQKFREIGTKHKLLICFIHHVSKAGESSTKFDKKNLLGNSSIEAFFRVVFEIKPTKNSNVVELGIVKGNMIMPKLKTSSGTTWELSKNEESLIFSISDQLEQKHEFIKIPKKASKQESLSPLFQEIFRGESQLEVKLILEKLEEKFQGINDGEARRLITKICGKPIRRGVYTLKKIE